MKYTDKHSGTGKEKTIVEKADKQF